MSVPLDRRMGQRKREPPYRNRSPYGWWIASYLLRLEYADEDRSKPNRRCLAWENTIILRASDRDAAYAKAIKCGKQASGEVKQNKPSRQRTWVFEGLTPLLPIYEEIDDCSEILWEQYERRTVRSIKSLVRSKRQLPVFDDHP